MSKEEVERLRAICLALPDVTEKVSHGEPSWFAKNKKLFLTLADHHHDDRFGFWAAAPPGAQEALIADDPERYFRPAYVGHRGWVGVYLDVPADWAEIADVVAEAHDTVATPKRGGGSLR
ncbi:MAG TPA: phosphoribosylglycinamide formyltransferase [Micromonosporaceae bacterium]|nr:phosphoribosylglycinamide formyltransferase [Micromonosporaceae bacterium]HCU48435.1 phosphoribosylglycinamide formyltransferase [Micromonosporaceae bacterium]